MPFPKNLVAYEIALERAFRMLLGSKVDLHTLPGHEEVGDAFFRKLEPGDFARQWLADEKFRLPDPDTATNDETDTQTNQQTQEEELF